MSHMVPTFESVEEALAKRGDGGVMVECVSEIKYPRRFMLAEHEACDDLGRIYEDSHVRVRYRQFVRHTLAWKHHPDFHFYVEER